MIEIERFFGGVLTSDIHNKQPQSIKFWSTDITLLSGPPQSGKSSLLFQYGYTYVKQGYTVLFICSKRKFQQNLPYFPTGFAKDDYYLKRLKIKYIESDLEFRNYLFDFPSLSFLPDLILIDDLSFYFGSLMYERNITLGKTLAFIKETLLYIKNQKQLKFNSNNNSVDGNSKIFDCKVIISDSSTTTTTATTNDNTNVNTTTTNDNSQSLNVQQPNFQQLEINGIQTYTSSHHPKFLYIMQRWTDLVININEILSINNPPLLQQTTTNNNTALPPVSKKYILSILKFKDNNSGSENNIIKDYHLTYSLKFKSANHQNNSYTLESIQIPKIIGPNIYNEDNNNNNVNNNNNNNNNEENTPTQPLF